METMLIDQIIESVFNIDPFMNDSFDYDPEESFKTESNYIDELITEATNTTKRNVIQRLWDIIKNAIEWLGKKIIQIAKGIKQGIFGNKKTANQILKIIKVDKHQVLYDAPDTDDKNIGINSAKAGYNSFIEGFYENGIMINLSALVSIDQEKVPVKGKNINGGGDRATAVVKLLLDPTPLNEYIKFFKTLIDGIEIDSINENDIDKIAKMCDNFVGRPSIAAYIADGIGNVVDKQYNSVYVSINQFMDFQKRVDEMCKMGEEFDKIYNNLNIKFSDQSKKIETKYMKIMNDLAWACVNLQGGLHTISNGLQGIYDIDPGYIGSIKTPEILADFASESIKYGMPAKYLVRNIYLVCDKVLKGNPNMDKPIMGFGRLTLIPEGDIIYKVAINQYGIRSNKNDFTVMNKIKGTPLIDKFAETTNTFGDYIVNVMEKVKAGSKYEPSQSEAARLGKEINNELSKMNIGFEIHDIKSDAFGMKDDRYVLLDYGYLHRTSYTSKNN